MSLNWQRLTVAGAHLTYASNIKLSLYQIVSREYCKLQYWNEFAIQNFPKRLRKKATVQSGVIRRCIKSTSPSDKKDQSRNIIEIKCILIFILISAFIQVTIYRRVRISFYSSEYLLRYINNFQYYLSLYLYVCNFQTGSLDA